MTAIFQSNRVKTNIEITSNSKADYLGADPNTSQLSQIICITLNMNNISNEPFHLVKKEIKKTLPLDSGLSWEIKPLIYLNKI